MLQSLQQQNIAVDTQRADDAAKTKQSDSSQADSSNKTSETQKSDEFVSSQDKQKAQETHEKTLQQQETATKAKVTTANPEAAKALAEKLANTGEASQALTASSTKTENQVAQLNDEAKKTREEEERALKRKVQKLCVEGKTEEAEALCQEMRQRCFKEGKAQDATKWHNFVTSIKEKDSVPQEADFMVLGGQISATTGRGLITEKDEAQFNNTILESPGAYSAAHAKDQTAIRNLNSEATEKKAPPAPNYIPDSESVPAKAKVIAVAINATANWDLVSEDKLLAA